MIAAILSLLQKLAWISASVEALYCRQNASSCGLRMNWANNQLPSASQSAGKYLQVVMLPSCISQMISLIRPKIRSGAREGGGGGWRWTPRDINKKYGRSFKFTGIKA
jgi:hypothetical protein